MPHEKFQSCIDGCNECATSCEHCASACLDEENVKEMTRCIKLNLDCAVVCTMAAKLMSRGSNEAAQLCRYCAEICHRCADECRKYDAEHCQACAESCERCADECEKMAGATVR